MKKFSRITCLLVIISLIAGCAMLQPQLPQTGQDKSAAYMSYYMAQLRDYEQRMDRYMTNPDRTEVEGKILSAKYYFLQNAWKPIAMYDSYVTTGTIPPATLEIEIMALMDTLEEALRGGK